MRECFPPRQNQSGKLRQRGSAPALAYHSPLPGRPALPPTRLGAGQHRVEVPRPRVDDDARLALAVRNAIAEQIAG